MQIFRIYHLISRKIKWTWIFQENARVEHDTLSLAFAGMQILLLNYRFIARDLL